MTSQLLLDFASEVTVVQYTSREFGAPNVYKQTVQGRTRIKKGERKAAFLNGEKDRRGFVHVKSTGQVCPPPVHIIKFFLHLDPFGCPR